MEIERIFGRHKELYESFVLVDDLLDIILGLVIQYMSDGNDVISHEFMSAQEAAIDVLVRHGVIKEVGAGKWKVIDG